MDSLIGLLFICALGQHIFGPIWDSVNLLLERLRRAGH